MNQKPVSLARFFDDAERDLAAAIQDKTLAERLQVMGYAPERIKEGLTLLLHTRHLNHHLFGESVPLSANPDFLQAWNAANAGLDRALEIARVAFKRNARAAQLLELHGERHRTIAGWLDQANRFFRNLRQEQGLAEALAGLGYGEEQLEADFRLMEEVNRQYDGYIESHSMNPHATRMRDARLVELDAWLSDYRAVRKIALADTCDNPE
jgi:hypothetical protein